MGSLLLPLGSMFVRLYRIFRCVAVRYRYRTVRRGAQEHSLTKVQYRTVPVRTVSAWREYRRYTDSSPAWAGAWRNHCSHNFCKQASTLFHFVCKKYNHRNLISRWSIVVEIWEGLCHHPDSTANFVFSENPKLTAFSCMVNIFNSLTFRSNFGGLQWLPQRITHLHQNEYGSKCFITITLLQYAQGHCNYILGECILFLFCIHKRFCISHKPKGDLFFNFLDPNLL